MEATPAPAKKLHPLAATAAVAVTVASVLGAMALISGPSSGLVSADAPGVAAPQASGTGAAGSASAKPAPAGANRPSTRTPHGAVAPALAAAAPPACANCGIVAGVRAVKTPGQGTGVGAVAGGVVGGLVGHEFGRGYGKDAMSVLGVVGGALAGNEVEKQARATTRYEVDVRLDNGGLRTVRVPADPGPIVGQRVRIENGQLVAEPPRS